MDSALVVSVTSPVNFGRGRHRRGGGHRLDSRRTPRPLEAAEVRGQRGGPHYCGVTRTSDCVAHTFTLHSVLMLIRVRCCDNCRYQYHISARAGMAASKLLS